MNKQQLARQAKDMGVDVVSVTYTNYPSRRGGNYQVWGYHAVVRHEGSSYSVLGQTLEELLDKFDKDIVNGYNL